MAVAWPARGALDGRLVRDALSSDPIVLLRDVRPSGMPAAAAAWLHRYADYGCDVTNGSLWADREGCQNDIGQDLLARNDQTRKRPRLANTDLVGKHSVVEAPRKLNTPSLAAEGSKSFAL